MKTDWDRLCSAAGIMFIVHRSSLQYETALARYCLCITTATKPALKYILSWTFRTICHFDFASIEARASTVEALWKVAKLRGSHRRFHGST